MKIVKASVPPYARKPRTMKPSLWIIHATRGDTTHEKQGQATLNWFKNAPNMGGWASTSDVLIDHEGTVFEFFPGDGLPPQHSSWSAGYGALGPNYEYGADECGISVELSQSDQQEPYSEATITSLVAYIKKRNADWNLSIPATHVTAWTQRRDATVPAGYIGHEETANGKKTGKSDPGRQFPWARFIAMLNATDNLSPKFTKADATKLFLYATDPRLAAGVTVTPQAEEANRRVYTIRLPK